MTTFNYINSRYVKKNSILFFLILFCNTYKLSAENIVDFKGVDIICGYGYQKFHTLNLGVALGYRGPEIFAVVNRNYNLTSEIAFRPDNTKVYGIGVGYKFALALVDIGGQLYSYSDFHKYNITFRPEIGLSIVGILDINYGYNFTTQNNFGFSKSCIIIRLTIGKSTTSKA